MIVNNELSDPNRMKIQPSEIINPKSKTSPEQGRRIKNLPLRWIISALAIGIAAIIPLLTTNSSTLNIFFLIFLFITLSQSWNILAGFAGQISLGHAAFFGIGALVMRTLWLNGTHFLLALIAGGI